MGAFFFGRLNWSNPSDRFVLAGNEPQPTMATLHKGGEMGQIANGFENLDDPEVRNDALGALGKEAPEILLGILDGTLEYGDDLRPLAASLLGENKYTDATKGLIEALKDDNMLVVKKATKALAEIGDRSAIVPLAVLVSSEDREVRTAAIAAIEAIVEKTA